MFVYVDWNENKVLSEAGKDARIAEFIDDIAHNSDVMYDFLREIDDQLLADIANGDDAAVEEYRNRFKEYVEKEAVDCFFEDYERVEIEG